MNRSTAFVTVVVALSFQACLSVEAARETAAQRTCRFADKCGDVGSGQTYASMDECLTKQRSAYLDSWSTASCEGKINADKYNVCITAIDNTQCNNLVDVFATATKCARSEVCSGGSGSGCNCGNGQTCCSNSCTSLQTDRNNCGGCGTTCGSGLSCQSGVCR
jgi:Family of unknown function (DUF6184)